MKDLQDLKVDREGTPSMSANTHIFQTQGCR